MNRDRKLLVTVKLRDGVTESTGTGCPYALPIENPTWLSIMDIATMFSVGKCEITCHNTSAPQVMTLAMYDKLIFQEKITDEMIQKAYDDTKPVTPPEPEEGVESAAAKVNLMNAGLPKSDKVVIPEVKKEEEVAPVTEKTVEETAGTEEKVVTGKQDKKVK